VYLLRTASKEADHGVAIQSTYQAVLDIIKREGLVGLYSGLDSSLLGIAVTNGCVVLRSRSGTILMS